MDDVRHHVNVRVFPADQLAVMPDFVGFFEGHECSYRPVASPECGLESETGLD